MGGYNIAGRFLQDRDDAIVKWCIGRKVLHIGACDAPHTKEKLENGLLLHTRLAPIASEIRGIDIDRDAIRDMADLGYHIDHLDMNRAEEIDFRPDVIVFGETIEHLTNFDSAFACLRRLMSPETQLIISTPNAFYSCRFLWAFRGQEKTHPEHVCLFSLQTLRQLLNCYDLNIDEVIYTFLPRRKQKLKKRLRRRLAIALTRVAPPLGETLLLSVRRKGECAS